MIVSSQPVGKGIGSSEFLLFPPQITTYISVAMSYVYSSGTQALDPSTTLALPLASNVT